MKKNRKTIAFFNGFYIPHLGGVERYTSKIIEQLQKDYNIIVVTTNDNNYDSYEVVDAVKVYRLPVYNLCKERFPFLKKNREYKKLINEIKNEGIDYIICNTRYYQTTMLGAKISKSINVPLFIIDHSSNHVSIGNKVLDSFGAIYEHYLTSRLKHYNPKFYGVSKKCNEWLKHFKIEASGVFYNSIDDAVYKKYYKIINNKKIVISYIGRIIPEKGILNLLGAFAEVNKKHKNIELFIAGDGPMLNDLREKYKSKNIKFLGKLDYDGVMNLCVKTDIFVHPSMYPEGLPTSILEAGVMKSAIIATDRGGTCEVINSSDVGLIVEENKDDLVLKLDYLLSNPKKIDSFKEAIHKRIMESFIWKETVKAMIKEIKQYGK